MGPLLFLLYINDLPVFVCADKICFFADESSMTVQARDTLLTKSKISKFPTF